MISVGVDLAAQPERTAVATIRWSTGCAVVEHVADRADDEAILQVVRRADKTGIDCPLSWPAPFVSFVTAHHARHADVLAGRPVSLRDLTMRCTDMVVREQLGMTPLSVSADPIAHVALRRAVLLGKLQTAAGAVDRSGTGPVAEVYPAASLHRWGLVHRGCKQRTKADVLDGLVGQLLAAAPWLNCAAYEQSMRR